jgi:hypothetical protein
MTAATLKYLSPANALPLWSVAVTTKDDAAAVAAAAATNARTTGTAGTGAVVTRSNVAVKPAAATKP